MEENRKSQISEATRDIVMTELLVRLTAVERTLMSKNLIEESELLKHINACIDELSDSIKKNNEGNEVLINFLKNRKK